MLNLYEEIGKALSEPLEGLAEIIRGFMYDLEYVEIENKKKIKHKPILNISPNKVYIRDKRNVNYYCRDNC